MASVSHKNITDADLHEPKGVAIAAVGTVYVADGGGSGAWAQAPYRYSLQADLADVSAASSAYAVVATGGVIEAIRVVLDGAITVGNSTVTFFINGVPITGSTISVAFAGSAAGTRFSSTPSAANTVVAGDLITATSDGGSTSSRKLSIVYEIKVG